MHGVPKEVYTSIKIITWVSAYKIHSVLVIFSKKESVMYVSKYGKWEGMVGVMEWFGGL